MATITLKSAKYIGMTKPRIILISWITILGIVSTAGISAAISDQSLDILLFTMMFPIFFIIILMIEKSYELTLAKNKIIEKNLLRDKEITYNSIYKIDVILSRSGGICVFDLIQNNKLIEYRTITLPLLHKLNEYITQMYPNTILTEKFKKELDRQNKYSKKYL